MSHNLPIGEIITTEQHRDAIHIAVIPVIAAQPLQRGDTVSVSQGKAVFAHSDDSVGVVDPYLRVPVQRGERFWLFLNPGTVTSLRHAWTHPDFPEVAVIGDPSLSQKRIAAIADNLGLSYDRLMNGVRDYLVDGKAMYVGDQEGLELPPAFWPDYEVVAGVQVDQDRRDGFWFRCTC